MKREETRDCVRTDSSAIIKEINQKIRLEKIVIKSLEQTDFFQCFESRSKTGIKGP